MSRFRALSHHVAKMKSVIVLVSSHAVAVAAVAVAAAAADSVAIVVVVAVCADAAGLLLRNVDDGETAVGIVKGFH